MPLYEFFCEKCDKTFNKVLTLAEYDKGEVTCPKCGSKKVVQEPSTFFCGYAQEKLRSAADYRLAGSDPCF